MFTRHFIHLVGSSRAVGVLALVSMVLLTISGKAQERINSIPDFLQFLSSIPKNEAALIILSDGRCGKCLLAEDMTYLAKLDSTISFPTGMVDSRSDFGKVISMKHRINKLPAILVLDNSGQLLRRMHDLPVEPEKMPELQLPFDTLPKGKSPLIFDLDYPKFFEQSFNRSAQPQPSDEVLGLFFQMNPQLEEEMTWAVAMRFNLNDEVMSRIMVERDTLIEHFGKEEVYTKLDEHFFDQMKAAVRSTKDVSFESIIARAELAFGQDEVGYTFKYKSYYYQLKGDWNAFLKLGNEINAKGQLPQETLVEMAQVLLIYSTENRILSEAAGWFSEELTDSNLEKADLKVILLWKGGEEAQAKELALKIKSLQIYSPLEFPYSNSVLIGQK